MKRDIKMFALGFLAALAGTVVAQTPTIFSMVRVTQSGSAGTPAYSWTSDSDSGLYRTGANNIVLGVNGGNGPLIDLGVGGTDAAVSAGSGGTATLAGDVVTLDGVVSFLSVASGILELSNLEVITEDISAREVGYKGIPQNTQSGDYTLLLEDAATHIYHPAGGGAGDVYTIPANASVAYPIGTVVTFVNADSDTVQIAITSDTMVLAGTTTAAPFDLEENGIATAVKIEDTAWIINGVGL